MAQSAQTGAFTLMLLVKNYKSQMIALLLKNGVAVPSGASDKQIIDMMASLLKISKSFYKDIMLFLQNPKVINNLAGEFSQNAQFFRADGFSGKKQGNAQYFKADGFMNSDGGEDGFTDNSINTPSGTPPKKGFFSGLNLGDIIKDGLGAFTALDKNKTDRAIADARAKAGLPPLSGGTLFNDVDSGSENRGTNKEGMGTTTVVVLSLVGIAVIGTIIYFVTRPKKV